jgi:hypothetical protein
MKPHKSEESGKISGANGKIWEEESGKPCLVFVLKPAPAIDVAETIAKEFGDPLYKGCRITEVLAEACKETIARADKAGLLYPIGSGACLETPISHKVERPGLKQGRVADKA